MPRLEPTTTPAFHLAHPLLTATVGILLGLYLSTALPAPAQAGEPAIQLAADEADDEEKAGSDEEKDEDEEPDEDGKKKHKSYQGSTEPSY